MQNPDILAELASTGRGPGQVLVGFAAETDDVLAQRPGASSQRKGCDLLVVNEVGAAWPSATSDNAAVVLAADGTETQVPRGPKAALADVIWDLVAARLS